MLIIKLCVVIHFVQFLELFKNLKPIVVFIFKWAPLFPQFFYYFLIFLNKRLNFLILFIYNRNRVLSLGFIFLFKIVFSDYNISKV